MLGPLCGAWAGLGAWGCFTIHYNLMTYITKLAYVRAPFVVPGRAWVGGAASQFITISLQPLQR